MVTKKLNVLLVCAAGMSSSLLELRIKKAAEKRGIPLEIKAVAVHAYEKEDFSKINVILVAPQARLVYHALKKKGEQFGAVTLVIDPMAYGLVNGEAVLDQILKALEEKS